MLDFLKRYIHADGAFKAAIVDTTKAGRELFKKIQPSPIGLQLLTQGMSGTLLLTSGLKGEGSILFQAKGNGPGETLTVEANTLGNVRSTMGQAHLTIQPDPSLGLFQQVIGAGNLAITRRTKKTPQGYQSLVNLVEGELSLNIANYLLQSDQTQSAIQLGSSLHPDLGIAGCGGIMIQALPGAEENILFILEQRLSELPPLGDLFASGEGHREIVAQLFDGIHIIEKGETWVQYTCLCSRQRMMKVMARLPRTELMEMRAENKTQIITCHFCSQAYEIALEDLDILLDLKNA